MTHKILVAAALLAVSPLLQANDAQSFINDNGDQLFQRFCAACHGQSGDGEGPVAPALSVPVPDLTGLSTRAGGSFPTERVREIIDGRAVLPAHGTRPMPVWGYELEARASAEPSGREAAQTLIDRLVEYLRSIQK